MLFSSDNKKSQIVPVLPAASREAGRVVTTTDSSAQKKSGLISAVRPAVGGNMSGARPAISGMRNAVTAQIAGAPTQIMPAVEMPGAKRRDGRDVAIWVLSAMLAINMAATVLLLTNMDRQDPEVMEQKVRVDITQEELALVKSKLDKLAIDSERRMGSLQQESDGVRGQLQLLQDQTQTIQRVVKTAPEHDPGPSEPPPEIAKQLEAAK